MPHLSQLQREHKAQGLTVIGVTSLSDSNPLEAVKKMVADKGEVMGYTVAVDEKRETSAAWMEAAQQRGIPTSFLVDKAGKVAWIGHPASVDIPLAMVLEGAWDYEEGPALMKKISDDRRAIYMEAQGNPGKALKAIDSFEKKYPMLAGSMDGMRFSLMLTVPSMTEARAELGSKLVDKAIAAKDAPGLNQIAWSLVDPELDLEERHVDLAVRAAEAGSRLTEDSDPAILDTLARAYFWKGDLDKALAIQKKAVENAKGAMKESLEAAVAEYEKAIKGAGVGSGK